MTEWSDDMGAAPKDGTAVLIATRFNTRWAVCEGHFVKSGKRGRGTWFGANDYGDEEFSQPYNPSCWMPLPSPPA